MTQQDPIQAVTARHAATLDAVFRDVEARTTDLTHSLTALGYTHYDAATVAGELSDDWLISALCETLQAEMADRYAAALDAVRREVGARVKDLTHSLIALGFTPQDAADSAGELIRKWLIDALGETLLAETADRDAAARDTDRRKNQ